MRTIRQPVWLGFAGISALLISVAGGRAEEKPAAKSAAAPAKAAVSETDKLQFTQKDVEAQMQELQDRMFHLASLTKESEPDNSTRLLLAVRKAREQLIMEQMKEVLEQLGSKDLSKATGETKQVLAKLEELKKLLIATDLELQLQLERLRQLNAALRGLDKAIKTEKQQQSQSEKLAGLMKKKAEVKPKQLDDAKKAEAANRAATQSIADSVQALGGLDSAAASLASAGQSMSKAASSLGSGKPGEANPQQSDATKEMEKAREELEKERQRVLEELAKQVKAVVIENLQEMLDRQTAVRRATEALSPKLEKQREARIQLQKLAPAEQRIYTICQQTLELVNETEFSVALPPALENLSQNMLYVTGDLTGGRGDRRVIDTEIGIEEDLRDLLETFKELPSTKPGDSQCQGCKGNMNKLLAELKVVRMLQMRINKQTLDADADAHRAAAAAELPPELREKIGKVRDNQAAARDTMDRLHKRFAE